MVFLTGISLQSIGSITIVYMTDLGLCLGSPLGDLYFDLFGTYKPCFWFFTVLMAVVATGFRVVIRAAYRDKEAVLAEPA